jgi:hypothetical protein
MSKEIIRQLKSLKHDSVKPDELWLKKNRELLLFQIKNTVSSSKQDARKFHSENVWQGLSIFLPQSVVYKVLRPAVALVLILGMGFGSLAATVSASSESLPGEWLYPAKRVAEKTQVAIADAVGNKGEVAKLHGELAKKRAVEISKIVSQGKSDNIAQASKMVNDLKDEMKIVSVKLEEIKITPDSSSEAVKNINQSAKEIKGVLEGVKDNLLVVNDLATTGDLSNQVSEVKNLVKDTAVKAVEIMVEKHLQGDTSISKEDVKDAISDQLESAVVDAKQSNQSVVEVNKAVDVVKIEAKAVAKDAVGRVSINANQVITDKIEVTSKQTQAAVSSAQAFSTEAGKTASEGQTLLSQDNLAQAVDKIKQANAATVQIEKISDSAIKAVQTILPVVAAVVDPSVSVIILSTSTSSTIPVIPISATSTSGTVKFISTTPVIIIKSTTTPVSTTK